jgi:GNAT superfamily N-acetyltransferase
MLINRLQAYLRQSAAGQYRSVAVAPFTIFLHAETAFRFFNYAIPDRPVGGNLESVLDEVRAVFLQHQRRPRFEFIEAFAPELGPALQMAGFVEEYRGQFMICTPATFRAPTAVPGRVVRPIDAFVSMGVITDYIKTQRQGFDPTNLSEVSDDDVNGFRRNLGDGRAFLGYCQGEPVAVAQYSTPIDRITEVIGVTTLPAFRRQGYGAMMTAAAVRDAFAQGVEMVCLSAADEPTGRVYESVGFEPCATVLAYALPG